MLTTATAAFSANVVTTDGAALNTSTMANFESATGQGTLSLVVDPQSLPSSSVIKDFKLRINVGGSGSLGAKTVSGAVKPANLAFDYAESAVLALSFLNGDGTGGKIVITANAKDTATIADPDATFTSTSAEESALAPTISITISVYNDTSTTPTYTNTWTSISALESDITAAISSSTSAN
jgi:hypothetical protein